MSTKSDGSSNPASDGPKRVRRLQTDVRTLIVLVACSGVILWALRNLWENYDPVRVEARSIQKRAIGALQSGKPDERFTAIQELERLRAGDSAMSIPPLIGALDDPDTKVRIAAIEALDTIGSSMVKSGSGGETVRASATALIRCLKDQDTEIRVAAVKALGSVGSSAMKSRSGGKTETIQASATALIGCLKDQEPDVRSAAALSLGELTPPRRGLLTSPPIDRQAVMDALAEMLGDRDAKVRRAAINAMALRPMQGGDPPKALAQGMQDEVAQNRAAAIRGLSFASQGLDPWVPMVLRLAEHDPDPTVRERCFTTLNFAFKPPAVTAAVVPILSVSLRSGEAKVRSQAASILAQFKADARAAIPELLRVLNEPLDPRVEAVRGPAMNLDPASAAAHALGQIAPGSAEAKQVIAGLMEAARSGPISRRGWAAVALGEFGPAAEEAVPVLIKVIKDAALDRTFEREGSAAWALGKIAPETPSAELALAALLPLLESKDWVARAKAVEALGCFGPKAAAAIPRVRALKVDREGNVKIVAAKALPAIENASAP
jgi:HEAT repeat protein